MDTYVEFGVPIGPIMVVLVLLGLGATYLLRRTRFALPIVVVIGAIVGYAVIWTFLPE